MVRDGKVIEKAPLSYAGEKSTFAGQLSLPKAGPYELQVLAMEAANANFGLIRTTVTVTP
ncbi:MAG: hypothetical protein ACE5MM_02570 [Nitrospiraceae bacterium]